MSSAESICCIVTPVGNLGCGFDSNGLQSLLRRLTSGTTPTALILNSCPEEVGPVPPGGGLPAGLKASYERDIRKLIRCVSSQRVPLILNVIPVGEGDGHIHTVSQMVHEAAAQSPQKLEVLKIPSCNQKAFRQNHDHRGAAAPKLERRISPRTIGDVVQTFIETAEATPGFDILISSSNSRVLPFMAFTSYCLKNMQVSSGQQPMSAAHVKGGVLHMAKLLEEGGVCAAPKCAGAVGTLFNNGSFEVAPVGTKSRCTSISVASYMMQNSSRLSVPELGGTLDFTFLSYEQLQDNLTVRVRGSILRKITEADARSEAQSRRPYRSVYVGSVSDASLMTTIDESLSRVKAYVQAQQPHFPTNSWDLNFHVHGRGTPEVIVAGEVTALTYDIARSIAEIARMATQLGFGLRHPGVEFPQSQSFVSQISH